MSTAPHYFFSGRLGQRLGDTTMRDGVIYDGLWCSFNDCHMIELAQYTAEKAEASRATRIDEFSVDSQKKAAAAQARVRSTGRWRRSRSRSARAIPSW